MNKTHIIVSAFNEDKSEFIEALTNISYVSKYFNVIKNKLFDYDNLENIDLYFGVYSFFSKYFILISIII